MAGIQKPFQDQPGVVLSRPGVVEEEEAPGCQLRDLERVGAECRGTSAVSAWEGERRGQWL